MTSANVSMIPVMPVQTQGKGQSRPESDGKDFMSIMSASLQKNSAADIQSSVGVAAPSKTTDQAAVDMAAKQPVRISDPADGRTDRSIQPANSPDKKQVSGKPGGAEDLSTEEIEAVSEALAVYTTEITQVIADDLQIPAEDVTEALDTLGMTPVDLADPKNLSDLLTELMDMSKMELITDPTFSDVTADIKPAVEELLLNVPVDSKEELPGFVKDFMQTMDIDTVGMDLGPDGEVVPTPEPMDGLLAVSDEIAIDPSNENLIINDLDESTPVTPDQGRVAAPESRPYIVADEDMDADEKQAVESYNDTTDEMVTTARTMGSQRGSSAGSDDSRDGFSKANTDKVAENLGTNVNQNVQTMDGRSFTETVTEAVERYTSIDTEDLIEQIVTQVRTTVTESITTMSLELHPASLGKMYVQVSEQDGTINAKLFTESESVKQALETQMTALKEQWEQQGSKVSAIEISVGTREFEEQMEAGTEWNQNENRGSGASGEADAEGTPAGGGIRSINLGDAEDGVPEDMTEAEVLAASMMRDRGNRMNIMA
mgnify:CR=1 FL=1